MLRTWILVADGAYARVFLSDGPDQPLKLVHDLEHPESRAKGQDLFTDKPRLEPYTLPKDHEAGIFARQIAGMLDLACSRHEYDQLIIVAPPPFLGPLRGNLTKQVQARVVDEVAKDLVNLKPHELEERLVIPQVF
jgi:protein required for attachment to host cells